jgi:hypothetical protein
MQLEKPYVRIVRIVCSRSTSQFKKRLTFRTTYAQLPEVTAILMFFPQCGHFGLELLYAVNVDSSGLEVLRRIKT